MLQFSHLYLRRGPRLLIEDATFSIFASQKVGLVGRNGTGKSSLFALMLAEIAPDQGDFSQPRNWVRAHVAQETPPLPVPALDFALAGDEELTRLETQLLAAEAAHDVEKISHIHERLGQIDGYAARARAAQMLAGLGFTPEMQARHVADFSGGWRMRLNLARALMCRSDLLLLDEPTNHLDLDAVLWLQNWLQGYEGTIVLVSHDREFLDAVCTHTLHLHQQQLTIYTGNYSQFERLRAEKLAQQTSLQASQQRYLQHLQSYVDRFRAQATKSRQAQSRIKMIEKIQVVAPVQADNEFRFKIAKPARLPAPLLVLDQVAVGYGDKVQLSGLKMSLHPGHRVALLGPNGAGKSTLIKLMIGELPPMRGEVVRASDLVVGYFAQQHLEQLDLRASPLLHFKRLDPQANEQNLRDYLGSFNFKGDRVFEEIEPFSGGEKARLALALVVYKKPNLLLLDEPTNHLDLDMRQALEMALQDFEGAVLMVSHDRHLVSSCADELWRVSDGQCVAFDGDLEDYSRWLLQRGKPEKPNKADKSDKAAKNSKTVPAVVIDKKILRESLQKHEKTIEKQQKRLNDLQNKLSDTALYQADKKRELDKLLQEQSGAQKLLTEAEEGWLVASEALG
jgi:ATP-binding cassette subfamily F protein 3